MQEGVGATIGLKFYRCWDSPIYILIKLTRLLLALSGSYLFLRIHRKCMSEQDEVIVGNTTTTHIEVGPPKFQTTIREFARKELGINDLDYEKGELMEKATIKAELEVIDIEQNSLD